MLADCLLIVFISICTAFLGEGNLFLIGSVLNLNETIILYHLLIYLSVGK